MTTRFIRTTFLQPICRRGFSTASRPNSDIPHDIMDLVDVYFAKKPTSITLQTLMKTGTGELLGKTYEDDDDGQLDQHMATERILIQVAGFVRRELPIRLAHRIHDLDRVPMMRDMPSVQTVKSIYISSFLELIDQPKIYTPLDETDFADTLHNLYKNHSNVLIQMARGAYELREAVRQGVIPGSVAGDIEFARMEECHEFLDRFYMSRIGIRVLAGQYLALRGAPLRNYVGMICSQTSPYEIVRHAAKDATMMCVRKYGDAPDVIINGRLDLTFPYIPTHLHYIMLELLKNAMRATCEKHGVNDGFSLPPVHVIIADAPGNEDIVIKVADEGGGIPRSQIDKIWSYLFTTADPQIQEGYIGDQDHGSDSPLAGLGYGLPISRSYARYFGGDLDVVSMEGYGTDAYVHLVRLGNSREPLAV